MSVERVVAIDWSGRVDVAGQRRHIFTASWSAEGVTLEAGRTRAELVDWLIEEANRTPRMVVGIDCCFSYPAWFLEELGVATVFEFWEMVAAGHGERWLSRLCEDRRFWGKPHKKPLEFCGDRMHRMMRLTDMENKITAVMDTRRAALVKGIAPKSPFQIGGSGSVGTGSLRAIPFLKQMHDAGFRVWPFEAAAFSGARPKPMLVEMYARLLTGAVKKSSSDARKVYLKAKMKDDAFYGALTRKVLRTAEASEDAFDALVSAMEMARRAEEIGKLRKTRDRVRLLEGITWVPAS